MASTKIVPPAETEEEKVPEQQSEGVMDPKDAEIAALKAKIAQMTRPQDSKETDYDRVHRIERETEEAGKDPWTVLVPVMAPHREKTEDPFYWLNVNGVSVQIPANDRYHELKLPWACVLVDLLKYERASIEFQESIEVFDPETNPHRD